MFKVLLPILFLFSTSTFAAMEISNLSCHFVKDEGKWDFHFAKWQTIPYTLAARETRVMQTMWFSPTNDEQGPGTTWCSELVGTATERFIIKTHRYAFQRLDGFYENSCKPFGEGIEFIELTADLIGISKAYFAETEHPWNPGLVFRTVFNVITGDQVRKLNEASDEHQAEFLETLCRAQMPRY
ncbi:hypothetical protein [Bdellovibrio sp. HCB209]|uniref:hypothetical protein n=1 Tax=Bdellovibrio sp. HCB209 TaxID=3394354 RepID=UPI0039B4E9F4